MGKASFVVDDDLNDIEVILTAIDGGLFGFLSIVMIHRYLHSLLVRRMKVCSPSMILLAGFVFQVTSRCANMIYSSVNRVLPNWFLIMPTLFHMFTMAYFVVIWGNYTSNLRLAYGLKPTYYQKVMALVALFGAMGCLSVWIVLWMPLEDNVKMILSQVDSGLDLGGCLITGIVLLIMSADLKKIFVLAGVEEGAFNVAAGLDHTQVLQRDQERTARIRESLARERAARKRREMKERRARAAKKRSTKHDQNSSLASRPEGDSTIVPISQSEGPASKANHSLNYGATTVPCRSQSVASADPTLFANSDSKMFNNESETFLTDEYDLVHDRLEEGSGTRGSSGRVKGTLWEEWVALFALENRHWRIAMGMRIFGIYSVLRAFGGVAFIVGGSVTRLMYTGFGFYTFEFIFLCLSLSVLVGPPEASGEKEEDAEEDHDEESARHGGTTDVDALDGERHLQTTTDGDTDSTHTGSTAPRLKKQHSSRPGMYSKRGSRLTNTQHCGSSNPNSFNQSRSGAIPADASLSPTSSPPLGPNGTTADGCANNHSMSTRKGDSERSELDEHTALFNSQNTDVCISGGRASKRLSSALSIPESVGPGGLTATQRSSSANDFVMSGYHDSKRHSSFHVPPVVVASVSSNRKKGGSSKYRDVTSYRETTTSHVSSSPSTAGASLKKRGSGIGFVSPPAHSNRQEVSPAHPYSPTTSKLE